MKMLGINPKSSNFGLEDISPPESIHENLHDVVCTCNDGSDNPDSLSASSMLCEDLVTVTVASEGHFSENTSYSISRAETYYIKGNKIVNIVAHFTKSNLFRL